MSDVPAPSAVPPGDAPPGAAPDVPPPQKRARIWSLTWRFVKRVRPYLIRLAITMAVSFIASGAKATQGWLFKPVLNKFSGGGPVEEETPNPDQAPEVSEAPSWLQEFKGTLEGWLDGIKAIFVGWFGDPMNWDLLTFGYLAVGMTFVMFIFGYLRDYLTSYLTERIVTDVREDVADHLAHLPLKFHYDRRAGDLVSRMTTDVRVMVPAAKFYFDDLLVHPITIFCALMLIVSSNLTLALVAVVVFPLYVGPLVWLAKRMRKARKRSLEHFGEMTGTMVQMFGGIKTVKAFNRENAQVDEFRSHNEGYFRRYMTAIRRKALGENMAQLFAGFSLAGFLVFGGYLLHEKMMTTGDMVILVLGVAMMNSSIRELTKSYNRVVEASTGCERVFALLDVPREVGHESGAGLDKVGGVEFRGVHFAYDGQPVLQGIDLDVKPGQVVAIVGRTGSGKTTLLDLVCRFYEPQKGEIRISGQPLGEIRRSSLLSHIAVVTQETFLFHTTIGENIRYGRFEATREQIEEAARGASIHDFIMSLENGYDTVVGERGAKLSGGQRQRLAIARAMLKDPSILILDEATSALDTESEKAVQAGLDKLMHSDRRITLVIAHRLSTVRRADQIVVLEGGRIAEQGTHDELMAKDGVYAGLYRTQFSE